MLLYIHVQPEQNKNTIKYIDMTAEHRKHVHMALLQTMIGAFMLSSFVGAMLGSEFYRSQQLLIPEASAAGIYEEVPVSVYDLTQRYMDCDCVGPQK